MLGVEQERWLAQGLVSSTRQWKLLGQSSQVSATGIDTPEGRKVWTDGWDGYPEARRRLLQGATRPACATSWRSAAMCTGTPPPTFV